MTLDNSTAAGGSSSEGPPARTCTRCNGPRDRKNSSYCRDCRNAHAAEYRARARPRPTYEERSCALEGCDIMFTWCSMHPKQICCSKTHLSKYKYWSTRPADEAIPNGTMKCSKCKRFLDLGAFSPSVRDRSGGHCRECARSYEKSWNERNADRNSSSTRRSRAARLLRTYGSEITDVDVLMERQGSICYLCGGKPGAKGFHIDHDHELHLQGLPSYRGMACHGCNVGIGALLDDPDLMMLVAQTLRSRKNGLRSSVTFG